MSNDAPALTRISTKVGTHSIGSKIPSYPFQREMPKVAPPSTDIVLSVVVACGDAQHGLSDALVALDASCRGLNAEIIVVFDVQHPVVIPESTAIPIVAIPIASLLVPLMWGRGVQDARGGTVALTTTQFRVAPEWAPTLLAALGDPNCGAVGGRMALAPGLPLWARALFLVRYSEHMGGEDRLDPREIAGESAAYRREEITHALPNPEEGFWEVAVHRRLRAQGKRLFYASHAIAYFTDTPRFSEIIANRVEHGAYYGKYRIQELGWSKVKAIAVTPAVPLVLLWRIAGRIPRTPSSILRYLVALPHALVILTAWAIGEAQGAWKAQRPPRRLIHD